MEIIYFIFGLLFVILVMVFLYALALYSVLKMRNIPNAGYAVPVMISAIMGSVSFLFEGSLVLIGDLFNWQNTSGLCPGAVYFWDSSGCILRSGCFMPRAIFIFFIR